MVFEPIQLGDNWKISREEPRGMILEKVWIFDILDPLHREWLFKPDYSQNPLYAESTIEFAAYKIAQALDIDCAETRIVNYEGKNGTLSLNFHTNPDVIYRTASQLYQYSGAVTFRSKDSRGNPLNKPVSLTVDTIRANYPKLQNKLIDMLFLDCLISNRDRHGGNWEVILDPETRSPLDIAPLFDHGASLYNGFYDYLDRSLVLWGDEMDGIEPLHFDMFAKLHARYPERIRELVRIVPRVFDIRLPDKVQKFVSDRYQIIKQCVAASR